MFYRLLLPTSPGQIALTRLPRVSEETRRLLAAEIDKNGFTIEALAELEQNNPRAPSDGTQFCFEIANYLHGMQGFAVLYKTLVIQASVQRARLH